MGESEKLDNQQLLECLYEKTYTCPVCDNIFKNKTVRLGRTKVISTDIDLKPTYSTVNGLYYSVVACQLCGYTAIDTYFDQIGIKQAVFVRQALAKKFVARAYPELYDANTAIIRYKLSLICSNLKKVKKSEFAGIALRLSWFYDEIKNEQKSDEYRNYAFEFFKEAYKSEMFPLFGYDEAMATYLIAALAYRLEKREEALKWLGNVMSMRNIQIRLKEKAQDLKEIIKKES